MCAFISDLECNNWEFFVDFSLLCILDEFSCNLDIVACKVHLECVNWRSVFGFYALMFLPKINI